MCTKANYKTQPNTNQPARAACQSCKDGECCGKCWCCCLPWPAVARLTKEALDAVCNDGYDWLSPQPIPGFAGPVNLTEVCGGSGLTRHVIPREAWGLPAMQPAVKNTPWRGRKIRSQKTLT